MVCDSRFHRGRDPQGLVNTAKIVIHKMKGDRSFMVLNLL